MKSKDKRERKIKLFTVICFKCKLRVADIAWNDHEANHLKERDQQVIGSNGNYWFQTTFQI